MRDFDNMAAQGDVMLVRIDGIPSGLQEIEPNKDKHHVIAHSESGHCHVIEDAPNVRMYKTQDPLLAYLEVLEGDVIAKHLRSHDTHESLRIKTGAYEVRRQRESAPEGWRRAVD